MNRAHFFIRNHNARDTLDLFIVSAASSILLVRFFLYVTGYPSIGGSKYHIAHMLWGGLFMLAAFVINFSFLGSRVQKLVALLGGIGFGIFIDEVGKFVTRDNDYFFRPSVGIIYAIFVILYLTVSFLTREQKLTNQEYQLNALRQLEEAVLNDMDVHERAATRELLLRAKQNDLLTKRLHDLLYEVPLTRRGKPGPIRRMRSHVADWYDGLWESRGSSTAVRWFFVIETLAFVFAVLAAVYTNFDDVVAFVEGAHDYGHSLIVGQAISTLIAAVFVLLGLRKLRSSRLEAFEWFRKATLVNLLLTEFFIFSRIQFGAMASFTFNLALLALINAAISQERQYVQPAAAASKPRVSASRQSVSG